MVFPFKSHRSTRLHNLLRTQKGQPAPHRSSRAASAGAPHPGRASASQPHSPHRQAPQTRTLQRQIPAETLQAPKPSNKTHWAAQGGFPVNSTCRTTLLYPNRSHPHTPALSPRGCSVTRSPRQSFQFHSPGGLSEEVEMCIVTKFNPEPRSPRSSSEPRGWRRDPSPPSPRPRP